jgi:phospholipid/cholesterol/gamma-HCH transport system substrate-binding protein
MEPRAHHLLIGLFTLIMAIVAIAFTLWLSKSSQHPQTHYVIEFSEAVRGLERGSSVQYNGIQVGEVVDLGLDPEDPSKIRVRILIDRITPVSTETRARLMLTGLTGRAVVELTGGGKRAAIPLTADDGKDPVILSEPSPFSKLFNNGDLLLNNVAALAASGRQFLTPENAQAFAQVLQNLAVLTESMAKQTDNIERMVADMSRISADTQTALRQAASLMASTKDLVDSDGKSTLQALQRTLGTIDQTSRSLGLIATDNRQTIAQGMRGFAELGPVLKELRATLNALRGVARALEAGPANYLLGREQLQEFEP